AQRLLGGPWPDLVGVDFSSQSLQLAHLVRRGKRVLRVDVVERSLVSGDSKLTAPRFAAQSALREIVSQLGLKGKPAAATLDASDITVRRLSIPYMKRSEILSALALEGRKHVSFPMEESEIRFEILNAAEATPESGYQLLVAIAHRRALADARGVMEQAGLRPVAITVRPVALKSLLESLRRTAGEDVVAYLEMGDRQSQIVVFKGSEIRFVRDFAIGGDTLTDALRTIVVPGQGTVDLSFDDARALINTCGIPQGDEESQAAGSIPLAAVSVMLRPVLERLVRELLNSFDYVNEQFLGEAVTRLVLLGEGAQVRNLPAYLTGILEIPTEPADLAHEALGSARADDSRRSGGVSEISVGLCSLRKGSLNFLEPAGAGFSYRLAEAVPQRVAVGIAAMLLLSVSLPAEVSVLRERQQVTGLQKEFVSLEPRTDALRRFRAAREEETRLQDLLARLSGGQVLWSYVLRDLSHRIGPEARLTALEVLDPPAQAPQPGAEPPRRKLRLYGLLRTNVERSEKGLAELMDVLSRSHVVGQVQLEGCERVSASMSSFTLTAELAE
ncbi:MAG: pilus assembly protein PilM, partial [Candidatus Eiseniibacteriota bacterium]